jgi:hypothetical protein
MNDIMFKDCHIYVCKSIFNEPDECLRFIKYESYYNWIKLNPSMLDKT